RARALGGPAPRRVGPAVVAGIVEHLRFLLEGRPDRLLGSALSGGAAHDDDVAAFLAADLEDLAANLLVGNRGLGRTGVADDLHRGPRGARHRAPKPSAV